MMALLIFIFWYGVYENQVGLGTSALCTVPSVLRIYHILHTWPSLTHYLPVWFFSTACHCWTHSVFISFVCCFPAFHRVWALGSSELFMSFLHYTVTLELCLPCLCYPVDTHWVTGSDSYWKDLATLWCVFLEGPGVVPHSLHHVSQVTSYRMGSLPPCWTLMFFTCAPVVSMDSMSVSPAILWVLC